MKNILNIILIVIITNSWAMAQSECSTFYPLTEGVITQITTYNKRGKVAAIVDYKILSVESIDGEDIAKVSMYIKSKKGKDLGETTYEMVCSNNELSIDINSLMNPQLFKQINDLDVEITGNKIVIPGDLSVGQELPDAEMKIVMDMAGIKMNTSVYITNREVEAIESVETPAGTFECYAISYQTETTMGFSKTHYSKQWIAKGVGMVKQEDYNKRGKITSSSSLTMFGK